MATTLDWVKSVRADIRGDCGKGWNLRAREVGGKMVMQIIITIALMGALIVFTQGSVVAPFIYSIF